MNGDPFLNLPGAVSADGGIAHFGAPLLEQRALAEGEAIVSLSHRGIIVVSGEDRLSWLNSMMSQKITGLQPGESVETLLLDPNGRIDQVIRLVDDGERAWLLVDEDKADSLSAFLLRMRFALRVDVINASDDFAAVEVFGGGSALGLLRDTRLAVVEWVDPWANGVAGGVQYARGEHAGADWSAVQMVFKQTDLDALVTLVRDGRLRAAGVLALDALEVRAWRPSLHSEVDERSIPHEFDWLRTAVHLNKGCYRGQETVAKVHNLGHPPRRLALLHLEGSGGQLPEAGALVYVADASPDSRPVGRITRSALHYEWGGIAFALLKRSVEESAELEVCLVAENGGGSADRIRASQEVIVPADAGQARQVPRLKRI